MPCWWVYDICTDVSEDIAASVCRVAHQECAWVAALRSVLGLGYLRKWERLSFKIGLFFFFLVSTWLTNLWHACPQTARGIHYRPNFFFLFLLPDQRLYIVKNTHTHTHTHIRGCVDIVYEPPLLPNNTASETFLHKSEAVWGAAWMFTIGLLAWQRLGEYVTSDETFLNLFFFGSKEVVAAAPVTAIFSSYRIPRRGLC